MIEVSLLDDNLLPFLTAVGWLLEHNFDDDDWIAVREGIRETDAEEGRWYSYEFYGGCRTPFTVAYDDNGGSVVHFRVDLPGEFEARLRLLGEFCWHFHWRGPTA